MTFDQAAIIGLLLLVLGAFVLDRWRIDIIALAALAIAFLLGLVEASQVFSGFSSPAVVTVLEILIITQVIAGSHVVDAIAGKLTTRLKGPFALVAALCGIAVCLSVFMNNIGALALLMPVALSACARFGMSPGQVLMPLSFATLLGGLCSLIGTPANLVISNVRSEITGAAFAFFDYAYVGVPLALAGLCWLVVGWRLLGRRQIAREHGAAPQRTFALEVAVPAGSPLAGLPLPAVEAEARLIVHGVFRNGLHVFARKADVIVKADDLLVIEGDLDAVDALIRTGELTVAAETLESQPDVVRIEAVVMPQSTVIGSALGMISAFREHGLEIVAVSPQRRRLEGRLGEMALSVGDVLVVAGREDAVAAALAETDCLSLAPRESTASGPPAGAAVLWFGTGIALAASGLVPAEVAFGMVVLALMVTGRLDLRKALAQMNWPVVVMLAAMIPVGGALQSTGAADLIARSALTLAGGGAWLLVAGTLLIAIVVTPFLNNVSTAIILAPIAASVALQAGLPPEPFLMAVAVGASTDFLTPFGYHNNTIVMGPGGYRFIDYPRLGAPLTGIVLVLAPPLLIVFWL
jgi:di/tricarboxylate transporter